MLAKGALKDIFCWCLDAGGVGVGVEPMDCGPSNELRAECELCMPFMVVSTLFWGKRCGGGGYEGEAPCMEFMVLNGAICRQQWLRSPRYYRIGRADY